MHNQKQRFRQKFTVERGNSTGRCRNHLDDWRQYGICKKAMTIIIAEIKISDNDELICDTKINFAKKAIDAIEDVLERNRM